MVLSPSFNLALNILLCLVGFHSILGYNNSVNEQERCLSAESPKDEAKPCYYLYDQDALRERITEYPIHPMILGRRSHYMQTGETMTEWELFPLLEAIRWGPSAFNIQPWRIVYAHKGTPKFKQFYDLLAPGNQKWNTNSSVLMILVTDMWNTYKGQTSFHIAQGFANGAAIGNLLYEGTARGYLVHPMTGYDKEKMAKVLGIEGNPHFQIEMMIAIGKREPTSNLKGVKNDTTTQRKKISEIVNKDNFKTDWRY